MPCSWAKNVRRMVGLLARLLDGTVATFINNTPKYVASSSLRALAWRQSTLLSANLRDEITALKKQTGKVIGVHGSIGLVQSLLVAGLRDELRLVLFPVIAG